MRGRCAVLALACLLLTGCSGLPYPREMGDMALLRTMGVDREEDGLGVTVSTGPRARGLQGEQEGAMVLSALRPSLSSAVLALQSLSDSYVFFGYVDQLLLGEGLTRDGVIPVLDYFARDVELGLGAQVWVIRDASARQAVESEGEQGVESRLSTLRTDGETGVAAISRTAGEVYSDLLEQGSCYLPALVLSGPDGTTLMVDPGTFYVSRFFVEDPDDDVVIRNVKECYNDIRFLIYSVLTDHGWDVFDRDPFATDDGGESDD